MLGARTALYAIVGAALTVSYPFAKRFFALPQFWLGAAFGWAIPLAFVATLGGVPRLGWLLFIVTILWAGVYDTQYAMVDRDDDLKAGVQSTAIAFGDMDKLLIGVMQLMVLGGLAFTGHALQLRLAVLAGARGGGAVVRLPAVADPWPGSQPVFQGFPEQQLGGTDHPGWHCRDMSDGAN